MKRFFAFFLAILISAGLFFAFVINHNDSPDSTQLPGEEKSEMVSAAQALINSMSPSDKQLALHAFDVDERTFWNYVPLDRKGLRYRDMNEDLRKKTETLLKTGLSDKGLTKAKSIMALEEVLGELEGTGGPNARRDPEKYWLAIFGEPSSETPWGWRFEGHHLSINFTSIENEVVAFP